MVIRIVTGIRNDRRQFSTLPNVSKFHFFAQLMCVYRHGKDIYSQRWNCSFGAPRDAVTFGNHFGLARGNDVTPVGIYSESERAGVKFPNSVGMKESQTGAVGYEIAESRIWIVSFKHEKPSPSKRVQQVTNVGRIVVDL